MSIDDEVITLSGEQYNLYKYTDANSSTPTTLEIYYDINETGVIDNNDFWTINGYSPLTAPALNQEYADQVRKTLDLVSEQSEGRFEFIEHDDLAGNPVDLYFVMDPSMNDGIAGLSGSRIDTSNISDWDYKNIISFNDYTVDYNNSLKRSLITHEVGHALGLDHNGEGSIMNYSHAYNYELFSKKDLEWLNNIYGGINTDRADYAIGVDAEAGDVSTYDSYVARFFDSMTGTHYFTGSIIERYDLARKYKFESYSFEDSRGEYGSDKVYQFTNTENGGHFMTTSASEAETVRTTLADKYIESSSDFYVFDEDYLGDTPIYRFFETNLGTHLFTTSIDERDTIMNTLPHYTYEGVAFYADFV